MNDVILNKAQSIQRCVKRAREELVAAGNHFATDFSHQDAAILNVLRACEQAIDLANYLVREKQLGIPTSSAESFERLATANLIDAQIAGQLKNMVGFRNLVVHEYQQINTDIVTSVIKQELDALLAFSQTLLKL